MANLDLNFLARPDFVVSTGENGKTITITLYPKLQSAGGFEEEAWNLVGWCPLRFVDAPSLNFVSVTDSLPYLMGVPKTVSPATFDNFAGAPFIDTIIDNGYGAELSPMNFADFIKKNPCHISRINLRTQNEQVLPQQIVVLTPNIFTGQSDRQIVDVASRKTAYQYQNGIITINDANLIIGRNSTIYFNGALSVSNGDQPENVLPENELYIDITIDKYLSLEKALVENLKLM